MYGANPIYYLQNLKGISNKKHKTQSWQILIVALDTTMICFMYNEIQLFTDDDDDIKCFHMIYSCTIYLIKYWLLWEMNRKAMASGRSFINEKIVEMDIMELGNDL